MSDVADAINGTVADMFGGAVEAQTEDTVQVAAPEAEVPTEQPETQVSAEEPSWDFEAAGRDLFADDPDDLPDFDAAAEAELGGQEQTEDVLAPNEYDDDQTRELKRQLLAEKKKAEYHARRHLETARKGWEADVKGQPWARFLPKDLSTIKASSHREFLRQAKTVARTNFEVLKPHFEELRQQQQQLREQTVTEARQEAAKAWGKPTVGGTQVPAAADAEQTASRLDQALRRRDMFAVTKALIDSNTI